MTGSIQISLASLLIAASAPSTSSMELSAVAVESVLMKSAWRRQIDVSFARRLWWGVKVGPGPAWHTTGSEAMSPCAATVLYANSSVAPSLSCATTGNDRDTHVAAILRYTVEVMLCSVILLSWVTGDLATIMCPIWMSPDCYGCYSCCCWHRTHLASQFKLIVKQESAPVDCINFYAQDAVLCTTLSTPPFLCHIMTSVVSGRQLLDRIPPVQRGKLCYSKCIYDECFPTFESPSYAEQYDIYFISKGIKCLC